MIKFNELRTKIVATIGPSSNNHETLTNLVKAGVSTIRVNFSQIYTFSTYTIRISLNYLNT